VVTGVVDLVCPQGATFKRSLTLRINNRLVNLSGYTARMQVRESYDSPAYLLSLTTASGITLGGSLGTIDLRISDAETSSTRAGTYVYDLEIISPDSDVTRLIQGKFKVTPEVTR
jgi:hypothetical protein